MLVLQVRPREATVQVVVKLSRFIADWPVAQQKFIGGMADSLGDLHPVGPEDFTITPAFSLGDAQARCRLFRGACNIVFMPATLQVNFSNVRPGDQAVVIGVVQLCLNWLAAEFGDHGRDWMSFNSSLHMDASDGGAVDAYLRQFSTADIDRVMQSEPGVEYVPSARLVCSGENGQWTLRRIVERSISLEDGVFVETQFHILTPAAEDVDAQMDLVGRLDRLADRAIGLQREEG